MAEEGGPETDHAIAEGRGRIPGRVTKGDPPDSLGDRATAAQLIVVVGRERQEEADALREDDQRRERRVGCLASPGHEVAHRGPEPGERGAALKVEPGLD